jgi:hypothetical protein
VWCYTFSWAGVVPETLTSTTEWTQVCRKPHSPNRYDEGDNLDKKTKADIEAQVFKSEIGATAQVEHHKLEGEDKEYMMQLREVLVSIAQDMQDKKIVNNGFEYLGSWSVHVYASEVLRAFEFVSLTNPHKATHPVAEAALAKLKQDINEHYSGKRQKLRSGF